MFLLRFSHCQLNIHSLRITLYHRKFKKREQLPLVDRLLINNLDMAKYFGSMTVKASWPSGYLTFYPGQSQLVAQAQLFQS